MFLELNNLKLDELPKLPTTKCYDGCDDDNDKMNDTKVNVPLDGPFGGDMQSIQERYECQNNFHRQGVIHHRQTELT